ncbi:hypothetical protein BD410DRAFT_780527, partial [Rickenella mellea]
MSVLRLATRYCTPIESRSFFSLPSFSLLPGEETPSERRYHERKILPYTQKQLYDVVADVDAYHHFVPYCVASRVLKSRTLNSLPNTGAERKDAELTVGFLGFKESYVSEVTCKPYHSVEAVASSSTPLFKNLVTTWRFQPASSKSPHPTADASPPHSDVRCRNPTDEPTLVSIDLVYSFANPLHAGVAATFFEKLSSMMVEAFEARCLQVYGPYTRP